jgi:hypothetical protein
MEERSSLIKNKEEEALKFCTFHPSTFKRAGEGKIRSTNEFLESQNNFLRTKEEKLRKAKEELHERETAGRLA